MFSIFKKKQASLDGNGERVDINYYRMRYRTFDQYQKSHFHRYKFAQTHLDKGDYVGDFACGTGYGSMMLAEKCKEVRGMDLNGDVISFIQNRYRKQSRVRFEEGNLLNLNIVGELDKIVSFETVEHLSEEDIKTLFLLYNRALKPGGKILFSTPYNQEKSEIAIKMGFHLTFYIVEETILNWLNDAGFDLEMFRYQNYFAHEVVETLGHKDFILTVARKK